MKLNLGCGHNYKEGYTNVDFHAEKCDVKHDLNKFPYPWDNGSVDEILAHNVLEEVENLHRVMEEFHRIMKPGAILEIIVPHYTSSGSWANPFHKRAFSYNCFMHYQKNNKIIHNKYGYKQLTISFSSVKIRLRFGRKNPLNWIVSPIANKLPIIYESTFLSAFPCMDMVIELRK